MSGKYVPDHVGTGTLMRSREIADHLEGIADDARRYAESIAPRETGEYASRFRVETGQEPVLRTRRAVARLVNDAEHAGAVESRAHVLSRTRDYIEQQHGR